MRLLLALGHSLHPGVHDGPNHHTQFLELVQFLLYHVGVVLELVCLLVEGLSGFVLVPGLVQPSLELF